MRIPRRLVTVTASVATVAAAAGVATLLATVAGSPHPGRPAPDDAALRPVHVTLPVGPAAYLGAYTPGSPQGYAGMESFTAATGHQPNIALYYSGWNEPFQASFARAAHARRAVVAVQIDPRGVSVAAIAAGKYDAYLISYARAVERFGDQTGQGVIIGFGHEMNGPWYPWGYGHLAPSVFVAAWRHIVDVFRRQGADNVTWLWTVSWDDHLNVAPPAAWWPGASYVTWVGLDGYYYHAGDQFAAIFGPATNQIRQLTLDPLLIAETAVAPGPAQAAGIRNLFAGIGARGDLGLIWFDADQHGGPYKLDWRLEGDPAALAAFRQASAGYQQAVG
jgi:mannan endo-1,4-beta-mannosidase